jgi:hypothetical protein
MLKNIKCGDYEVISSGSVIAFADEPVDMIFNIKNREFKFRVIFAEDTVNCEERCEFENAGPETVNINIINSLSAFGTGPSEPQKLGATGNRDLLFSYRVYTLSETNEKLLHYTWYLK